MQLTNILQIKTETAGVGHDEGSRHSGPTSTASETRFLKMDAEDLTLRDVKDLLAAYKRLAEPPT